MQYQPFVLLLHKLGFQLPADAGSIFARIPDFWTPEMMYILAKKLGPLDKCKDDGRVGERGRSMEFLYDFFGFLFSDD